MVKLRGILLSIAETKKIDSKYSAIARFYDIENRRLHQLYFPKDCSRSLIERLKTLRNQEIEIEIQLPYNLVVLTVFID